ncbi:MAG: hypothetical protein VR73_04405 [Gammaproteobacteria bacterium BRH_c0]|nr:MAG: hypothetical protein VR73_04405 [Gammaproteobacteria bacterium BRH_c0]
MVEKNRQVKKGAVLLACTAMVVAGLAWAVDEQQVIESRQSNYRELGGAYKGIRDELQKRKPLMIMVRQHVDQLGMLAHSQANADWFPAGSGPEAGIETEALPVIWEQRDEFDRLREELNQEAIMLADVLASGDMDALADQHRALGMVCKQCHDVYRLEDD